MGLVGSVGLVVGVGGAGGGLGGIDGFDGGVEQAIADFLGNERNAAIALVVVAIAIFILRKYFGVEILSWGWREKKKHGKCREVVKPTQKGGWGRGG